MNLTLRIALITVALALLGGCGNKGPLVLPTPPAPIDPATVPETPAETTPDEVPAESPATEPAVEGTETPPPETPAEPTTPPADDDGNG
jgi:predicted small lipoprotein YifL